MIRLLTDFESISPSDISSNLSSVLEPSKLRERTLSFLAMSDAEAFLLNDERSLLT